MMTPNRVARLATLTCVCVLPAMAAHGASLLDRIKAAAQALQQIEAAQKSAPPDAQSASQPAAAQSPAGRTGTAAAPAATSTTPAAAAAAGVKIDRQVLGQPPQGAIMTVSPAGQHVGWAGFQGSRSVMIVDGVTGQAYDTFMPTPDGALQFSDDGAHYAYLGRNGDQIDTIVDGKVLGHTPYNAMAKYNNSQGVAFGPHGHHVYFVGAHDYSGQGGYRIVLDGVPGPTGPQGVAFSPDGRHYAYAVTAANGSGYILLDGKRRLGGGNFQFGADGRMIVTAGAQGALAVDGHTLIKAGTIGTVYTSPVGGRVVTSIRPKSAGPNSLWVDGKIVASPCEVLKSVTFSPDGKRYIAVCGTTGNDRSYAVIDGHKGREYFNIRSGTNDGPAFTADGSHVIYHAQVLRGGSGAVSFMVVDDKEFGPYKSVLFEPVLLSAHGGGYAFVAENAGQGSGWNQVVIWSGREVALNGAGLGVAGMQLWGAGAGHLFFGATPADNSAELLFRDGQVVQGVHPAALLQLGVTVPSTGSGGHYGFAPSPDGTHLAYLTAHATRGPQRIKLHLDDRILYDGLGNTVHKVAYTPDSRHVFWVLVVINGNQRSQVLYLDDKPVLPLPPPGGPFDKLQGNGSVPGAWQMGADGALQFLTREADGVVRYHISLSGAATES